MALVSVVLSMFISGRYSFELCKFSEANLTDFQLIFSSRIMPRYFMVLVASRPERSDAIDLCRPVVRCLVFCLLNTMSYSS